MLRSLKFMLLTAASAAKPLCTVQTKEEYTASILKQYCEDTTIDAHNKPSDIRVGVINNAIKPISCLSDNTKCNLDTQLWNNHATTMSRNNKLDENRNKKIKEIKTWQAEAIPKFQELTKGLSLSQFEKAKILLQQLNNLKNNFEAQLAIEQDNFGNCGEQAAYSAIHLLQLAQKNDLNLQIHQVSLKDSTRTKGGVNGHVFLLINSDAKPVNIEKDSKKTKEYLQRLKNSPTSGDICDSWNKGLFAPLDRDTSGVYDDNGPWDTIKVTEFHFDFKTLKTFSIALQQFFCEELAKMGLAEEPQKICQARLSR